MSSYDIIISFLLFRIGLDDFVISSSFTQALLRWLSVWYSQHKRNYLGIWEYALVLLLSDRTMMQPHYTRTHLPIWGFCFYVIIPINDRQSSSEMFSFSERFKKHPSDVLLLLFSHLCFCLCPRFCSGWPRQTLFPLPLSFKQPLAKTESRAAAEGAGRSEFQQGTTPVDTMISLLMNERVAVL